MDNEQREVRFNVMDIGQLLHMLDAARTVGLTCGAMTTYDLVLERLKQRSKDAELELLRSDKQNDPLVMGSIIEIQHGQKHCLDAKEHYREKAEQACNELYEIFVLYGVVRDDTDLRAAFMQSSLGMKT